MDINVTQSDKEFLELPPEKRDLLIFKVLSEQQKMCVSRKTHCDQEINNLKRKKWLDRTITAILGGVAALIAYIKAGGGS